MNRLETLRRLKKEFLALGIEDAEQEARHALSHVLGVIVSDLYLYGDLSVPADAEEELEHILTRRRRGEPLAYLLGERYFMGMPMQVDARVLIPRQETELLCEAAIELIHKQGFKDALDLCTGSGCVAVSLGKFADAQITASDISADALEVAEKNAAANGVQVDFIRSDLFLNIERKYDIITANPPYISEEEFQELSAGIRAYEPEIALLGGADGLDFYRRIAREAPAYLRADGALILEIGESQANAVCRLLEEAGFDRITVTKDYAGFDRLVTARRPAA